MTKMTKKEMFAEIIALAEGRIMTKALPNEVVDFCNHEIELLSKRNSKSGQTKVQKENEILIENLIEALAEMEKPVTITEFQKLSNSEISTLSNQKLNALFGKLIEQGRVVRTVEKKKAYFSIAPEGVEE